MQKILFTVLFLLIGVVAFSQHSSAAYRKLADSLYVHHHYSFAADYYQKALKKSAHPGNIMLQLAKCSHNINRMAESEKWFIQAKQNHGAFSTDDYCQFAQVLIMLKKREQADTLLAHVLQRDPDHAAAEKILAEVRNFEKYYEDSAVVAVQRLLINSDASEFAPVYYKDGIVFSSSRHEGSFKKKSHWDNSPFLSLYYSRKTSPHGFEKPTLFEKELNTRHHDGPAIFFAKNQKMIINRNQRIKAAGRRKVYEWRPGLYEAQFDSKKSSWEVVPLPFNNPAYSYLHPSISEDGTVLYFASDKPGGYGGTDIYRTIRSNGTWDAPVNLGAGINTAGDEAFPFFIDHTLYFTSNGHGGLGGLDLFKSEQSAGSFARPVNLGYPLNSTADDFSLITDETQRNGYLASSRYGDDDLFSFQKLAINQVLALGLVTNTQGEVVHGYKASVTDKKTGSDIPVHTEKGVINFLGERGETYSVTVDHENYQTGLQELSVPQTGPDTEKFAVILKNKSDNLNSKLFVVDTDKGTSKMYVKTGETLNEITEKDNKLYLETPQGSEYLAKGNLSNLRTDPTPVLKELGMQKSDRSNLRNIYFDFDMAILDKEDKVYLEQLKNILQHDLTLKLIVAGHADDRGEEDYNINLSRRRVQAVTKYLISQGIVKDRIIQKAYGESLPVIPCYAADCSEADHQKNRRAEFVLRYETGENPTSSLSKMSINVEIKKQR